MTKKKENINIILESSFEDSREILNKEFPISLGSHSSIELIDRIHQRIPHISKVKINYVLCLLFQSIREIMLLNKSITFNGLITYLKAVVYETPISKSRSGLSIKFRFKISDVIRNHND